MAVEAAGRSGVQCRLSETGLCGMSYESRAWQVLQSPNIPFLAPNVASEDARETVRHPCPRACVDTGVAAAAVSALGFGASLTFVSQAVFTFCS